jgi:adenine-specific DNA-methyltransferase
MTPPTSDPAGASLPLALARPTAPPGVDLRRCDVADLLDDLRRLAMPADLVIADPPWSYRQEEGNSVAADHYAGLPIAQIRAHLTRCGEVARPGARMMLWATFPLLPEVMADGWHQLGGWRLVTGASWHKEGGMGQGFHARGDAEIALLYVREGGGAGRPRETISNAHSSPREQHSRKPVDLQRAWIRAFSDPGALVLDPYAGLGSVAAAAAIEGRRYVGAEIDPTRHADALALIARDVWAAGVTP